MQCQRALLLVVVLLAQACATAPPLPAGYPASPDEIAAVRQVVAANEKAYNARDLNAILAIYADDAKIESLAAGGKVNKAGYRDAMAKLFTGSNVPTASYGTPTVGFADPTHATAQASLKLGGRAYQIQYQMEKRDGRWLIVDQKYL